MAVQGCALDDAELAAQAERYAQAGRGAVLVARDERRVIVELADAVDEELVTELLAVERRCCPFFELEWRPESRRLSVAVANPEDQAALSAVARALGFSDD
jgi:hypothetical protein